MSGGGEADRLGDELQKSVRFRFATLLSLSCFCFASLCPSTLCLPTAYLAAFGHGGDHRRSPAPLHNGDSLCLKVHLSSLSPPVLRKKTCLPTRRHRKPLPAGGACHMCTCISCSFCMGQHVFSCMFYHLNASRHASRLSASLSGNRRFWRFSESEAGDPQKLPRRILSMLGSFIMSLPICMQHAMPRARM